MLALPAPANPQLSMSWCRPPALEPPAVLHDAPAGQRSHLRSAARDSAQGPAGPRGRHLLQVRAEAGRDRAGGRHDEWRQELRPPPGRGHRDGDSHLRLRGSSVGGESRPLHDISMMSDCPTCVDGGRVRDRRVGADLQSQRHDGQVLRPPVQS